MHSSHHEFFWHGSHTMIDDEDDGDDGGKDGCGSGCGCGYGSGFVALFFGDSGCGLWDLLLRFPYVENYPIEPPLCIYDCLPWDWNWIGDLRNEFVWNSSLVDVFIRSMWKEYFHIQGNTFWKHAHCLWKARSLFMVWIVLALCFSTGKVRIRNNEYVIIIVVCNH